LRALTYRYATQSDNPKLYDDNGYTNLQFQRDDAPPVEEFGLHWQVDPQLMEAFLNRYKVSENVVTLAEELIMSIPFPALIQDDLLTHFSRVDLADVGCTVSEHFANSWDDLILMLNKACRFVQSKVTMAPKEHTAATASGNWLRAAIVEEVVRSVVDFVLPIPIFTIGLIAHESNRPGNPWPCATMHATNAMIVRFLGPLALPITIPIHVLFNYRVAIRNARRQVMDVMNPDLKPSSK
jgi:hypothetical protein